MFAYWGEHLQQAQRPESIEGPDGYAPQTVVAKDALHTEQRVGQQKQADILSDTSERFLFFCCSLLNYIPAQEQ